MKMVRVEKFGESKDEDCGWVNLVFLKGFSLKILSGSSLHFVGTRVFIVGCVWNAKSQLQPNRVFWRLKLATGTSREFESRANCLVRLEVLSCSATAGVTLQLPYMLHTCASFGNLPIVSQSRDPITRLFLRAHSWAFLHTLEHTTLTWFPPKYRISKCWITTKFSME